jgi:ABC-type nitrate/sulfonate/bicarbonate transport system substrate-binding protein
MMIYDKPPFAIVGRKSRGITADVKSLEGKKFGAPAADAAYAQWPIFRAVNKLNDAAMKFENVGFPVREPMLASGEVDAVFGFANSSYINVKSRGVPVDDIVTMLMADYGVELYGNVIMVSPKFLTENPKAAKALADAYFDALAMIRAEPKKSFEIMGADVKQSGEQFEASQKFLRWQDREANQKFFAGEHAAFSKKAAEILMEAGIIKSLPDMSRLTDTRFLK